MAQQQSKFKVGDIVMLNPNMNWGFTYVNVNRFLYTTQKISRVTQTVDYNNIFSNKNTFIYKLDDYDYDVYERAVILLQRGNE